MANQYNNKVIYNGTTLVDLSEDTVTSPEHIMRGAIGHLASGQQVVGTGGSNSNNPTLDTEWKDIYSDWAAGYYYDPDNDYAYTQIPSTETSWAASSPDDISTTRSRSSGSRIPTYSKIT